MWTSLFRYGVTYAFIAPEEASCSSVSYLVADLGEHHGAEEEATVVIASNLGANGESRARRIDQ